MYLPAAVISKKSGGVWSSSEIAVQLPTNEAIGVAFSIWEAEALVMQQAKTRLIGDVRGMV